MYFLNTQICICVFNTTQLPWRTRASDFWPAVCDQRNLTCSPDYQEQVQYEMSLCLRWAQSAEGEVRKRQRTMIFCSSVDSCRAVEHALRERGLPTLCYHGDVPLDERGQAMQRFSGAEEGTRDALASADVHAGSSGRDDAPPHSRNDNSAITKGGLTDGSSQGVAEERPPLLVCSDLAAR